MNVRTISLVAVLLIVWCLPPVIVDTFDEQPDFGHDEDVHPNTFSDVDTELRPGRAEPGTSMETGGSEAEETLGRNWGGGNYEDADWHPPTFFEERHFDLAPEAPPVVRGSIDQDGPEPAPNQTNGGSPAQCGEYSSQLSSNGLCQLMATLPPVEKPQKRCPDMFRCTDEVSYWFHENQNRKDQLEELRGTMRELQAELRNHRHRVKVLEMQVEDLSNSSLDQRLRSLEQRHAEANTLLHVHAALLYELQVQLRNLSAAAQQASRHTGCVVNVVHASPPLGLRDALAPDGPYLSFCPSDCASLYHNGVRRSGIYTIILTPGSILPVYCDMETEGGGWTVFQRRRDGSLSFNRGWSDYRDGFGEPRGEHWLGNQQIHLLSNQGQYSLRIDMQDWSHAHRHASYHSFRTDNEQNQYRLHVTGFSGTVEDSFGWYHDQQGFSTPDTGNICAEISHAGWWYRQCFFANLNGVYYKGGRYSLKAHNLLGPDGIVWFSWKDTDFYSLKAVSMMMRPRNFRPRLSP